MALLSSRMDQFFVVLDTPPKICLDSVKLIREVKKYPLIYNSWLRRDQFNLCAAWELVIAALIPHFDMMADSDKSVIRRKVRIRWSWMRSTLRRDLSRNKMQCHIHLNWMQEMQFLVPLLVNKYKQPSTKRHPSRKSRNTASESSSVAASNIVTSTTTASCSFFTGNSLSSSRIVNPTSALLSGPSSFTHYMLQANDPNETMVKAFISSFASEVFTSSTDPNMNFLFTLLHIFRKVGPEKKAILKQKFSTFLRQ